MSQLHKCDTFNAHCYPLEHYIKVVSWPLAGLLQSTVCLNHSITGAHVEYKPAVLQLLLNTSG